MIGLDDASRVVVSADNKFVYVAGLASLAVFSRDASTGALQQLPGSNGCLEDPAPTWHARGRCESVRGFWPADAALTPDGRNLYLASAVDDRAHGGPFSSLVEVFDRDAASGRLTERPGACQGSSDSRRCTAARALQGPSSLVVSPDGRNVYVGSDGGISVFRRTTSGALVQLTGRAGCLLARAASCTPRPLHTGGTALLAASADGKNVYALAAQNPGSSGNPMLVLAFKRNRTTGALTELPAPRGCLSGADRAACGQGTGLNGLPWEFSIALSRDGRSLYVGSGNGLAVFARQSDGHLRQLGGAAACLGAANWKSACTKRNGVQPNTGVAVSTDGKQVYFAAGHSPDGGPASLAVFVRTRTGALTLAGCVAETRPGCGPARGLGEASSLAVTTDGRSIYLTGRHGDYPAAARILVFQRA